MRTRTILYLTLALALFASLAMAADVSGKWTYAQPGRDGQTTERTMTLKADGATLTGAVAGRGGEQPITNGKIDGDKISFDVKVSFNDNNFVMHYTGVVAGDEIKFKVMREGADQAREFTAKRAK